jgi:hypothetical protein
MTGDGQTLVEDLDAGVGAADQEPLPNQPMRRRVERVLEDDAGRDLERE